MKEELMMHTSDQSTVIPLWPDSAPGSEHWSQQDQETYLPLPSEVAQTYLPPPFEFKVVRNIARPTLMAYLPDPSVATGTAVVVCPGGVFHYLSLELEGTAVARWLCARGVAAFVLKHRVLQTAAREEDLIKQLQERFTNLMQLLELMQQIEPLALADGLQAIKVVRQRAAAWGVAPQRIGILGFSSGGVVASGAAMQYAEESRPNFAASIYLALSGRDISLSQRMLHRCFCWLPTMTRWVREPVCLSIPRGEMPVTRSNCTSMPKAVMASG
jgi:acetyl esterase/lipase